MNSPFLYSTEEPVFSVSEFLDFIIEIVKPVKCIIQGEVTSVDIRGMNVFFTISDKKEKAVLNCYIYKAVLDNQGIQLKEGTEIQIRGDINIYKPSGKFSVTVKSVSLVGEGALKIAFERLKKQLYEAGYFDEQNKKPIPHYVRTIGLITSVTAAAKKDFLTNLRNFDFKIYFIDTRVEGMSTEGDVVSAIRRFNEAVKPVDVIVITRGGGSLESLQAFNSIEIAKAIRASKIPVITAIGHEKDNSIADYVADYRASTPTDAGKYLSRVWELAAARVENYQQSIISNFKKTLAYHNRMLDQSRDNVLMSFERSMRIYQKLLEDNQGRTLASLNKLLSLRKQVQEGVIRNIREYERQLSMHAKAMGNAESVFFASSKRWMDALGRYLETIQLQLELNDPHKRLKQGYSIVTDENGKVVKSSEYLSKGELLKIKLYQGNILTRIENKSNDER